VSSGLEVYGHQFLDGGFDEHIEVHGFGYFRHRVQLLRDRFGAFWPQ